MDTYKHGLQVDVNCCHPFRHHSAEVVGLEGLHFQSELLNDWSSQLRRKYGGEPGTRVEEITDFLRKYVGVADATFFPDPPTQSFRVDSTEVRIAGLDWTRRQGLLKTFSQFSYVSI